LGEDLNSHGVSMDQVAAQYIGNQTPLPSLELGISLEATGVDLAVGYTRVYGCHIAWSGPTTPLARERSPKSVFERLLRSAEPRRDDAKSEALLLDRVLGDAKDLRAELGQADRRRLDEYLSIVRSLEQRAESSAAGGNKQWKPRVPLKGMTPPPEEPKDYAEHVRLMLDMIALAFQTDATRVSTFMFGNAVSNVSFRWLDGVSGSHHDMSHHANDADKLRQYQLINKWYVAQYAYLLGKLRDAKEGESNVLDNSAIIFASAERREQPQHAQSADRHSGKGGRKAGEWTESDVSGRYATLQPLASDSQRNGQSGGTFRGQHEAASRNSQLNKSSDFCRFALAR
jgi:hypothetical protein